MEQKPIPFTNKQASGHDPLGGAGVVSMNIIREATGAIRRRPGILAHSGAPTEPLEDAAVSGLYATQTGDLFAVLDVAPERPIYRIASGSATSLGASPAGLRGARRPVFAETQMLLIVAGGEDIQKIELGSATSSRLGGSPPQASHVAALTSRLAANDVAIDSGIVRFSDVATGTVTFAGHEVWSLGIGDAGVVAAEGRPDAVLAVHENTNELFVFGATSLQVFQPDPATVFSAAAAREFGISAPYSVVKSDQQFFWLDEKRRFVLSDGRSYEVISDPVKGDLDGMGRVDDCFGYRVVMGPADAVVWTFPSDGRSFVFQKGSGWGQWQGWDGNWTQLPVTAHCLRSSDNRNLVGLSDGRIGEYSLSAQTDLGAPINAHVTTGYNDNGTTRLKHCACVKLTLRRGETQLSSEPHAWLRYRDRPGPWQGSIPIRLGRSGDTEPVVHLRSLGTYRRRQWQFEFAGIEPLVLVSAIEEFEILEN